MMNMQTPVKVFSYTVKPAKATNLAFIKPPPCKLFASEELGEIERLLKKEDYIRKITLSATSIEVLFHHGKEFERINIIEGAIPRSKPRKARREPLK